MVGTLRFAHPTNRYEITYSVTCLSPHCLQTYLTRVAPFSAWTRFGAPHLPQTASIRVLPCLTTRAFFSIVSRIRRSASSRIACFDIGLPRREPYDGVLSQSRRIP